MKNAREKSRILPGINSCHNADARNPSSQPMNLHLNRILLNAIPFLLFSLFLAAAFNHARPCQAASPLPCLRHIPPQAGFIAADADGNILAKQLETTKFIPASTLKILTALACLHYLGPAYRFSTEFFLSPHKDLVVKGYGDPLLVSEVWKEISERLALKISVFQDLILDSSYFSPEIRIPGVNASTNPYDAPVGSLCANFNTITFKHNSENTILSAEPQTPMIPFAKNKIRQLGERNGRYTFSHESREGARYAGELLRYFLEKDGVEGKGCVRHGIRVPGDSLIYVYRSRFTLEEVLKKMFKFSNNFMANQMLISLGGHVFGAPSTLAKGQKAVLQYARETLGLKDLEFVEGSGISRKNRLSPGDMLRVLKQFRPYRRLLPRMGPFRYKTGTLKGIHARAGFYEKPAGNPGYLVLFLNHEEVDADRFMRCLGRLF
jgi:serine-type D-Ala-D-Ala carboxypeptidase/endopeptidase (penicillin-binding protein 4)